MKQRFAVLLTLTIVLGFGGFTQANPHSPTQPVTPTDLGVVPILYEKSRIEEPGKIKTGNGFYEVNQVGDYDYGYKIDRWNRNTDGTYQESGNSITITTTDYVRGDVIKFNWSSTSPLNVLVVKASTWYCVYFYDDGSYGDEGLYAPEFKGIGHVSFGWGMPEINLQDSSYNNIYCSTGTYDFGYIPVGDSSSEETFTIQNIGTSNLNLTGSPNLVDISGIDAAMFTINQSSTTTPIGPSYSTTFTIMFSPTSEGVKNASISIANDDKTENPYTFTVTGRTFLFSASKLITPGLGGTLSWSNVGDLPGGFLVIPPGAVDSEVTVTVTARNSDKVWDDYAVVYYLDPPGLTFNIPVQLTIGYRESWITDMNVVESEIQVWHLSEPRNNCVETQYSESLTPIYLNNSSNIATVNITHFSCARFYQTTDPLYKEVVKGECSILDENMEEIYGSDCFWNQTQTKNILLLHGWNSKPRKIKNFGDALKSNMNGYTIRYYEYEGDESVIHNAEILCEFLNDYAQPGFKTNIIAHSMGGLVARYVYENLGLANYIEKIITLGTPHQGTTVADWWLDIRTAFQLSDEDKEHMIDQNVYNKFPALCDLIPGSQLLREINNDEPNGPCYVIWSEDDAIVPDERSAQGLNIPLELKGNFEALDSGHSELHKDAETNGVLDKIVEWLSGNATLWASNIDSDNIAGIAFDDQHVWVATTASGGRGPSHIHKLNNNGAVSESYTITSINRYVNGLASKGIRQLYSFDQFRDVLMEHSNTITSTINTMSQGASGLANGPRTLTYGQSYLWAISNSSENELHKIDPSTLRVVKTYDRSGVPDLTGICWANMQLWGLGSNNELYKLTLGASDVNLTATYNINDLPGGSYQLAFNGQEFLVASNNCIYKVSQPAPLDISILGEHIYTSGIGSLGDVVYENDVVYVGRRATDDATSSISALDVSNVNNVSQISALTLGRTVSSLPLCIQNHGNYLVIGCDRYSTYVVNKQNPSVMSISDSINFGNRAAHASTVLNSDYYYLASGWGSSGELRVINWSNPNNIRVVKTIAGMRSPGDRFAISGNYLYTVWSYNSGAPGLKIFDISTPDNPIQVSSLNGLGNYVHTITVDGNYAYIGSIDKFHKIDISNINTPVIVNSISWFRNHMQDIIKIGNYILVSKSDGLYIFNDDGNSISLKHIENPPDSDGYFRGFDIDQQKKIIYVAQGAQTPSHNKVIAYSSAFLP
ncbi:MAG: choice-of-anchor D domain-containing protein [Planctomycetes bacterium]|nr:choice-of-anchor D domain-containing protein [Planctomycetota bacterium]